MDASTPGHALPPAWPESFGKLLGDALPPLLLEAIASEAQAVSKSPNFWTSRVRLGRLVFLTGPLYLPLLAQVCGHVGKDQEHDSTGDCMRSSHQASGVHLHAAHAAKRLGGCRMVDPGIAP